MTHAIYMTRQPESFFFFLITTQAHDVKKYYFDYII